MDRQEAVRTGGSTVRELMVPVLLALAAVAITAAVVLTPWQVGGSDRGRAPVAVTEDAVVG